MTEKTILVALPTEERHQQYLREQAEQAGVPCQFVFRPDQQATWEEICQADAIIGNVPADRLAEAENLQWLQLNSAGADPYDRLGVLPDGCLLTNAVGAYSLSVSEHMVAQTFTLIRHLHRYRDNQNQRVWKPEGRIISVEGAHILVLGMGDIGAAYARKMKALGAANVVGIRKNPKPLPEGFDAQYTLAELDQQLPLADIVAMVLPGNPQTFHVMNAARLGKMKPGAYLLNAGRGNGVDTAALLTALQQGQIAGAALDVFEEEPLPESSPLWQEPNLVLTPHIAGHFFLQETFERVIAIAGENLLAWLTGKPLRNLLPII